VHISEGVLSPAILGLGAALAVGGTAIGLRRLDYDRLMTVAILAAAFFVGSLIHVPVGPASAHLILNGLVGVILGWAAFPAIFVALVLQAMLFQFGGVTTLGLNTAIMAAPALIVWLLFAPIVRNGSPRTAMLAGGVAGALAVLLSGVLAALALYAGGDESFAALARVIVAVHLPIMLVEGAITAFAVGFLRQVHPQLLETSSLSWSGQ